MTERSACELRKDELHDIRWKISILYVWTKDCWFCLRLEWQIFWNCKNNKDSWMIFLLRCFESSDFHWCLRVLSNINYKFCYYCLFHLSFFEERKIFCVNKRTEKCHEYFEVDFNDCIDTETFELFSFNWWNHINNRFQFEKMKRYLVSNQF